MTRALLLAALVAASTGCGAENDAAEPVGEGRLAYVRNDAGESDIYVRTMPVGKAENVTRTPRRPERPADEIAPSWSPDGTMLAYMSTADHEVGSISDEEIFVMRSDGSEPRRLTDDRVADVAPHWTDDGRVAFTSCVWSAGEPPKCKLDVISTDGSGRETLADDLGFAVDGAISPDNTRAAFTRIDATTSRASVVVRDLEGGDERRLAEGGSPEWSPDGDRLVFLSDRDENGRCLFHDCIGFAAEIYVMGADGSGQKRLTDDPSDDVGASWTPDGEWIVFGRIPDENGDYDVHAVRADGSCEVQVTDEPEWELTPAWTGDTTALSC
jgi:TolB protein